MFRSSLRSVSDPFRDNVCFSCLAIRLEGHVQTRAFRSTRLSRAEAGNGDSEVKPDESPAQGVRPPLHKKPKTRPPLRETKSATWSPRTDNAAKDKPKHLRNSVVNKIRAIRSDHDRVKAREPGSKPLVKKKGVENNLKNLIQQIKTPRDSQPLDQKYSVFPPLPGIFTSSATGRRRDKLYLARQNFKELNVPTQPVPNLAYGLQRVLFNPGVYHLRDPRSHVFNFDPYLGSIMPVTEFDFAALKDYVTSSRDEILRTEAIKSNKKYIGSSSSMTSVLSHFHYLLSAWRPINTDALSRGFDDDAKNFTRIMRAPAAMILRYKDGVYAIDADKEFDSANILMNLGKSMEKLLTLPKDEFERYRRSHQNKITPEEEASLPESYHYSTMGDFLMRSQLDAHDPRLPGTGMFDLKTRAVISIRMDARNFEAGLGYQIKSRFGKYESYEREYFDMIRAAFLKYSLQVRIGRMDGIFVAFHNIERIFGFQYISLSEMDQAIHGQTDTALGDGEFRLSLQLWNKVLNRATEKYPGKSLRFHFETRDTTTPFMYIFYEPVTDEEIESIQTRNKAEIDAYQQRILKYAPNADGRDPAQEDQEPEVAAAEDEAIADTQEPEVAAAKNEVIEDTPPKSEDLADTGASSKTDSDNRELSGMVLMALNRVNGRPVGRPYDITEDDSWSVEYELTDLEGPKVKSFYNACQHRRKTLLEGKDDFSGETAYLKKLRRLAYEGRKLRKAQDKYDRKNGVTVLDGVEH